MARETLTTMPEPTNPENNEGNSLRPSPTRPRPESASISHGVPTSPESQRTADAIAEDLAREFQQRRGGATTTFEPARPIPTERPSAPLVKRRTVVAGLGLGLLGVLGFGASRLLGKQDGSARPTPGVSGGVPAGEPATATPAPTVAEIPATAAPRATDIPTLVPQIIPGNSERPVTPTAAPTGTTVRQEIPTEVPPTQAVKPTEIVAAPRPEIIQAMPPVKIETDPKLASRPISPITHIGINVDQLGAEAQNTLDEGISYGISMWEQVAQVAENTGGFEKYKFEYLATAKLPKVDPEYKPTYKPLPLSALPEGANLDLSLVEDGEFDPKKPFTIEYSDEPQLIPLVGQGKTQGFGYTWRRLPDGAHKLVLYAKDGPFTIGATRISAQDAANKQYTGVIPVAMAHTSLTFGRVDHLENDIVTWDGRFFVKNFGGQVKYDTPGWEKMFTKMTGPITPDTFGPYALKVDSPAIKK